MRALVLWADDTSANLGVRALAQGTSALLRRAFPDVEVVTQNYGAGSAPVRMGSRRSVRRERLTRRGGLHEWLSGFDLAVDTRSGDSFADIYGRPRLADMSEAAAAVRRAGARYVLGPQTIGPFDTRAGRRIAARDLRRADVVMARDARSAQVAADLGRPVDVLTTDVVFALDVLPRHDEHDVLLNVSGLLWHDGPHVDAPRYRQQVLDLHDGLVAAGRRVTLLVHVLANSTTDDDTRAAVEFGRLRDVPVVVPTSLTDVRTAVAGAQVVIGSRMHACLNALSVGTPAVPLAYSRKFGPLLERLGWTTAIDLRDPTDPVPAALAAAADPALAAAAAGVRDRAQELLEPAVAALRGLG
jgi:polysaccharide pyruvyl transferase WcaK-like protein